jgi:hypothetical protein
MIGRTLIALLEDVFELACLGAMLTALMLWIS